MMNHHEGLIESILVFRKSEVSEMYSFWTKLYYLNTAAMAIQFIVRALRLSMLSLLITLLVNVSHRCEGQSSAPLPSPQVLMDSWQQLHDNVKSSLHSYQLEGSSRSLSEDGKPTADPASPASWLAINSGERFLWSFTDDIGPHQIAARNGTYDAYSVASQYDSFASHNKQNDRPIGIYLKYYLHQRVPFRLETFIDYPTLVCTPEAIDSNVPFAQYYKTLIPKLKTVGTDIIGSWQCFHVQMSPDFQPKGMFLPSDIWFAVVGNQFVPVQFYLYDKSKTNRSVITVTKLQSIGTTSVPVTYRTSMDFIETLPSGVQDWGAHPVPRYHEANLLLSHINDSFPDDTFKIDPKPGTKVFVNEKLVRVISPLEDHRPKFIKSLLVFVFIIGCLYIGWERYRARKYDAGPRDS